MRPLITIRIVIPALMVVMLVYAEWGRSGYRVIVQGMTWGQCNIERGYARSQYRSGSLNCLRESGDPPEPQ